MQTHDFMLCIHFEHTQLPVHEWAFLISGILQDTRSDSAHHIIILFGVQDKLIFEWVR